MPTYYDILQVKITATQDEIKESWRKLVKQWHPDRYKGPNPKEAEENIKKINEAYEILRDEDKRKKYDQDQDLGATFPKKEKRHFSAAPTPSAQPQHKARPAQDQNHAENAHYMFYNPSRPKKFDPPINKTAFVYSTTSSLDKLFDAIEKAWHATQKKSSFNESLKMTRQPDYITVDTRDIQRMDRVIDDVMLTTMILLVLLEIHLPKNLAKPHNDMTPDEDSPHKRYGF